MSCPREIRDPTGLMSKWVPKLAGASKRELKMAKRKAKASKREEKRPDAQQKRLNARGKRLNAKPKRLNASNREGQSTGINLASQREE